MNRADAPAQALLLAACAWLPACGLNQAGVAPPSDTIAFPASAVMDRNGDWLIVTNSNADLRYNDGTLMAFSLTRAAADRARPVTDFGPCPQVDYANPRTDPKTFCCWDAVNNNILNCDERSYVGSDAEAADPTVIGDKLGTGNVRIGSFSAGIVLQQATCPIDFSQDQSMGEVDCASCDGYASDTDRLLLGVRGDTSLTWIDVAPSSSDPAAAAQTPPAFNCTAPPGTPPPSEPFATCDDAHRIIQAQTALASPMPGANPPAVPLPDEPYALGIDYDNGLLYIGHLTGATARPYSGGFSLFDIAPRGNGPLDAPRFIAPFMSPVAPNSLGAVGITTINVHRDMYGTNDIFASSRFVPDVASLGSTATCPTVGADVREVAAFGSGINYDSPIIGGETRGVQFIDDAVHPERDRAFVLQRSPPTLIGFVASDMAPSDFLETCGSPTFLDKYPNPQRKLLDPVMTDDPGTRLFVTCFADGEVYVYDPFTPQLVRTFAVGRGPSGLVFDPKRNVAYVVGFGDNNISVVDLQPGSRTQYTMVQRIGFPRTAPR
jgi:hypothetical protein